MMQPAMGKESHDVPAHEPLGPAGFQTSQCGHVLIFHGDLLLGDRRETRFKVAARHLSSPREW